MGAGGEETERESLIGILFLENFIGKTDPLSTQNLVHPRIMWKEVLLTKK